MGLFGKYNPATLTKDEVKFFDEQVDLIARAALPPANITPAKKRMEILKIKDEFESLKKI